MSAINTSRLALRPFAAIDLDALHTILSDPMTMGCWPAPFTRDHSEQWLMRGRENFEKNGMGRLAVLVRQSQALVGTAGIAQMEIDSNLENDLGYIIHHPFWRQGYAVEAANALLVYGFGTLSLPRICANMARSHVASRRVAEKIGMQLEKEFVNSRNRDILTCLYASNRSERGVPSLK